MLESLFLIANLLQCHLNDLPAPEIDYHARIEQVALLISASLKQTDCFDLPS
jgi:hypothetical protein